MRSMALRYAGPGLVVSDGFQQPLFSEGFAAQFKGPQGRVRAAKANLNTPMFDIDHIPDSDGDAAAGLPPSVPGEPVDGFFGDGPDVSVVADGQGSAGLGEPDVHGGVEGGGFWGDGHEVFRSLVVLGCGG